MEAHTQAILRGDEHAIFTGAGGTPGGTFNETFRLSPCHFSRLTHARYNDERDVSFVSSKYVFLFG